MRTMRVNGGVNARSEDRSPSKAAWSLDTCDLAAEASSRRRRLSRGRSETHARSWGRRSVPPHHQPESPRKRREGGGT